MSRASELLDVSEATDATISLDDENHKAKVQKLFQSIPISFLLSNLAELCHEEAQSSVDSANWKNLAQSVSRAAKLSNKIRKG